MSYNCLMGDQVLHNKYKRFKAIYEKVQKLKTQNECRFGTRFCLIMLKECTYYDRIYLE